ncbi:protein-cysteine N-palmitoyltransferase Rasp isoform X2 [Bacillus rossius redtenbacheri]|uniref:protein-cysteine N-palmitoyltransferase Rasp isoform X2 n=1 Tax=Bacillus rossius redtenbacheri TaxID=93214 RepID=UPI002FDCD159
MRSKDQSDYEWAIWTDFLSKSSVWLMCNSVGAEIIRWIYKEAIPVWYIFVSVWFLAVNLGLWPTLFAFTAPCIMYILSGRKSRCLIWGLILTGMLLLSFEQLVFDLPDYWQYLFSASQSWMLIRCVAFAMERINNESTSVSPEDLTTGLAYCLYFPAFFLGPIIGYQEFKKGITKPFLPWRWKHCLLIVLNLFRFLWWWLFTEVALHFIYSNGFAMHPQIVKHLDSWSFYGMGYCMGQFFMLKYVVVYGLISTVAQIAHIEAPRHPKCIARIYLYSDMWRYFDQGLYTFLKRYIYVPCLGSNPGLWRKLASSFVCFCFIFLWHKPYISIFVWSFLNFLGVAIERICNAISKTESYMFMEDSLFQSQQSKRRYYAFISTPLFLMSAFSNFYFFGDVEIGNIFIKRFFEGPILVTASLFTFAYCCCQVSMEISNMEGGRGKK